ncbi:unnamed protein product [Eruca vesicaria subsp. sativa]|uniref:RIN4 pathogenic type III effector avirulence factor Avr cleavage site domain-containing protein n=1 Tax=Eruca vesicaria subsp. sativa TaxID=29727 RepID=A0ABC8IPM7_ERUVS|nr:unnamed protein product [Eruca vesicaria subsp. sativa]
MRSQHLNPGWTPVPQFGGWDQKGIDATDYSVVFKKARANRKLSKADVTHSLGSEQELMASARQEEEVLDLHQLLYQAILGPLFHKVAIRVM